MLQFVFSAIKTSSKINYRKIEKKKKNKSKKKKEKKMNKNEKMLIFFSKINKLIRIDIYDFFFFLDLNKINFLRNIIMNIGN